MEGKQTFKSKVESFFKIKERNTTVATEIVAGIVTFLAMAYILTVNPTQIVGSGSAQWSSVFIATALGAIVGTLLMAFLANMPLGQAPGMGLNSMVGGLIGGWGAFQCSLGNAMFLVFVSGVLFLLLSVITIKKISIRELIFDGIPVSIRRAISVGIGLFIAYIGMQNCGLIVHNPFTQVGLFDFSSWNSQQTVNVGNGVTVNGFVPAVCLIGVLAIAVLEHFKVKGSIIIGIVFAALCGIPMGVTKWSGLSWNVFANIASFFDSSNGGTFLTAFTTGFDWSQAKDVTVIGVVMMVITFCMIDMFDTMGTVVGCCSNAGLLDENEKPVNYNKIMVADSVATVSGSLFGTSSVTTFVESGAGISAGGKTGLTALTTAVCFLLSIFLLPLIASIPSAAASSALIYVGCLMLKGATNLKLSSARDMVASFVTIALMPLAYSITTGIGFGILTYVFISLVVYVVELLKYAFAKDKEGLSKPKFDVSIVCLIVSVLFVIYFCC